MIAELWLRWWPVARRKWPVALAFAAGWGLGAWVMSAGNAPKVWNEKGVWVAQEGRRLWVIDPNTRQWVEVSTVPK